MELLTTIPTPKKEFSEYVGTQSPRAIEENARTSLKPRPLSVSSGAHTHLASG